MLANLATSALGRVVTPKEVYDLMRSHPGSGVDGKLCDPNGATIIGNLAIAAELLGCKIASNPGWQGTGWSGWLEWSNGEIAKGNPVALEVGLGQVLKDSITNSPENYVNTLHFHFFGKLGYFTGEGTSPYAAARFNDLGVLPAGGWYADGDNWAGNNGVDNNFNCANQLQYYTDADMTLALPCAGFSLVGRTAKPVWTTQTNGDGKDGAGHDCSAGFMKAMAGNPSDMASDGLASSIALPNNTAFLALENGTLYIADPPDSPFKRFALPGLAQEWIQFYGLYQKAASAPPPPAPLSPADQAAINAVAALKAALAN